MELDVINAAMIESGVDLETEEEFQTLSEEELEQASEAQAEYAHTQEEEQLVTGDSNINKELGQGIWRRGKVTVRGYSSPPAALREVLR